MKYNHFILIRNSIIGIIVLTTGWFLCRPIEEATNPTTEITNNIHNNPTEDSTDSKSLYRLTVGEEITAAHEEIIAMQKNTPLSEGQPDENNGGVKLLKKMATFQIDFRCDKAKGFDYFNRVKIDWNYDKKWDEKWDIRKNGSIKRQCSTKDDENYDLVQETVNGKWKSTTTENNTTNPIAATTIKGLSNKQQEVLNLQKNTPLTEGKADGTNGDLKYYKKMGSYFVDLRCDKSKGFDYWNRVKIDWNMDKNWEEKWDIRKDGSLKRQFSSKDNTNYDTVKELK